ncbi:MAG: oxygen-independent coproporphyrinogen III oxidase [Xanthobacteraceae bacterium]|nr:oxygen-independent coproporphyrinogen III oxidase [Xanthobacteraceae bacterium]
MSRRFLFAEQKVPRYTSYPTAPHFQAKVGPTIYSDWLSQIPADATLSLYVHVPFCTSLCIYCGCHTQVARRKDPLREYVSLLGRELELVMQRTSVRKIARIHWGGGTPSAIGGAALAEIMEQLARLADITAVREHAIELDPRHVRPELVHTLAALGINRVSLGVQTFAAHVQAAMGRVQPFATVRRAIDRLRQAGIDNFNFDLMYGLPRQTTTDLRETIDLAVGLNPQRLALFGYAHVPWFRPRQRLINEADLPGVTERFDQMNTARQHLYRHGFEPIGLDHFALPSDELAVAAREHRLHRNFQGYTDDGSAVLIGLGSSSIGRVPQGFVQNAADVVEYTRRITSNQLATVRGIALTDDDRARGKVIEELMCYLRTNLPPSSNLLDAPAQETLAALQHEGLVHHDGRLIIVPETARPLVRLVAAAFDAYLPNNAARHSAAV